LVVPGPLPSRPAAADPSVGDRTVGLYLHVPFCERVCPYCDFAVVATRRLETAAEERYVAALLAELSRRRPVFEGRALASVYLGGGTPSLLRPVSVARLVAAAREAFAPGDDIEVTLEVNPSTLERERLPGFREAGVTRLSLGVQSFDDTVLKRLGRAHRAGEARRSLAAARRGGFSNLSLDLIFGVPGQDRHALRRDLAEAAAFAPEHVSAYALTVEAGTPYARGVARGRLLPPAEDEGAAMMEEVCEVLEAAGLRRYEISSFARPGFESRHNRRYWERRPVLGLGVGAVSSDPARDGAPFGLRRSNPRSLAAYLARVEAGVPAAEPPPEILDERTARGEAAFLALRTRRGLDARRFEAEFGARPRDVFGDAIRDLQEAGLLEEGEGGDLRLTPRGVMIADTVSEFFL
jgi:oxygen-independent coproporphyrinogen-3 oxidase